MVNNRQYTQASVTICEICLQFCHRFVRIQNNAIIFLFFWYPGQEWSAQKHKACTSSATPTSPERTNAGVGRKGVGWGVGRSQGNKSALPVFATTDAASQCLSPLTTQHHDMATFFFCHRRRVHRLTDVSLLPCLSVFPASQPGRKKEMGAGTTLTARVSSAGRGTAAAAAAGDCVVLVQCGDEEQDLLVEVGQLARGLLPLLHHAADVHQHRVALCALPLSKHTKQHPNHTLLTASEAAVLEDGAPQPNICRPSTFLPPKMVLLKKLKREKKEEKRIKCGDEDEGVWHLPSTIYSFRWFVVVRKWNTETHSCAP